jgi:enoyl-CoA hydratase/carnithine racemase
VQTLRVTETMAIADALTVESLAYTTLQAGPEFARWLATREQPAPAPVDAGPPVLLSRDGDALFVVLNRPGNRNAISVEMRDALVEAFELAAADDSMVQLHVSGAGACFSVGGDLAEFGQAPSPAQAHMIRMQRLPARALLPAARRATFHLHSACIGAGIEIPAFAGRVTASADAFFQLPEIRFGLIPGAGGCVSIPRRIGRQRMASLALSARRISARTALSWGLIDAITH